MKRPASFAGQFYPSKADETKAFIESFIPADSDKPAARALMVPHAGYIFSGKTAVRTYSSANIPENIILIGPAHRYGGAPISLSPSTEWEYPGGSFRINRDLSNSIVDSCEYAVYDEEIHEYEHSLEVQLPILGYFSKKSSICAVLLSTHDEAVIGEFGYLLQKITSDNRTMLIASSDMSHYISRAEAEKLDSLAFRAIEELDHIKLLKTVKSNSITMCGAGPAAAVLAALKGTDSRAELIDYTDSGEVTGDISSVVAYAGFRFT